MRKRSNVFMLVFSIFLIFYCCQKHANLKYELIEVAQSHERWTGVAVSKENRVFVNYPRWSPSINISVAEILESGEVKPFPNEECNNWSPGMSAHDHFVCVQSVYIDPDNLLWILDPANAWFQGVVNGGAKLIKVDLDMNQIIQTIYFNSTIVPTDSYLNDVRVDPKSGYAYITDSRVGNLVVVNLTTAESWRVLYDHPSTKAENITLNIEGIELSNKVHVDGLALDLTGEYLYYQALTGRSLYRIKTAYLRDATLNEYELGEKVEYLGQSCACDAIAFGHDGNVYLTSLEHNAIRRFTPPGKVELVVQDPRLKWPDSFSVTADGTIYVTTAQIHLGDAVAEPFRIFKLQQLP